MNDVLLDHERHDPLLIAAHVAGDASPDSDRAAALVRDCDGCSALAADLGALATAVRDLPVPARPRDFTLTPEGAARLRRGGWRRAVDLVRRDGFRLARPVGAGLASLGFAGMVLASTIGAGTPAGNPEHAAAGAGIVEEVATPSDMTTSVSNDGAPAGAPAASPGTFDAQQQVVGQREVDPDQPVGSGAEAGDTAAASRPNEAMIVVSGSLFIVGMGLFGLRWTADRLGDG